MTTRSQNKTRLPKHLNNAVNIAALIILPLLLLRPPVFGDPIGTEINSTHEHWSIARVVPGMSVEEAQAAIRDKYPDERISFSNRVVDGMNTGATVVGTSFSSGSVQISIRMKSFIQNGRDHVYFITLDRRFTGKPPLNADLTGIQTVEALTQLLGPPSYGAKSWAKTMGWIRNDETSTHGLAIGSSYPADVIFDLRSSQADELLQLTYWGYDNCDLTLQDSSYFKTPAGRAWLDRERLDAEPTSPKLSWSQLFSFSGLFDGKRSEGNTPSSGVQQHSRFNVFALIFWLVVNPAVGFFIGKYKKRPIQGLLLGLFLSFAGWLLILAWSPNYQGQQREEANSTYNQEELNDGRTRFTVIPAAVLNAPNAIGCAGLIGLLASPFIGAVAATSMSSGDRTDLTLWGFMTVIVAVSLFICVWKVMNSAFSSRVNSIRSPGGTFVVSLGGIEMPDGSIISQDRLHRLILRNGVPSIDEPVIVATSYAANSLRNYQASAGAANRAAAERISYMLCAEHGGKSTVLAGGMTEVTAFGLMQDVGRLLNVKG